MREPVRLVRELPLVDQQAGLGAAGPHLVEDLVERHLAVAEVRPSAEAQDEERGRHRARHDDLDLAQPSIVSGSRATTTGP